MEGVLWIISNLKMAEHMPLFCKSITFLCVYFIIDFVIYIQLSF